MPAPMEKGPDVDAGPGQVFREVGKEGQGLYIICFGDQGMCKCVRVRDLSNRLGTFSWERLQEAPSGEALSWAQLGRGPPTGGWGALC